MVCARSAKNRSKKSENRSCKSPICADFTGLQALDPTCLKKIIENQFTKILQQNSVESRKNGQCK